MALFDYDKQKTFSFSFFNKFLAIQTNFVFLKIVTIRLVMYPCTITSKRQIKTLALAKFCLSFMCHREKTFANM